MSRNVAEHQLDRTFVNSLNQIGRQQVASRTLQPQGSDALELQTFWGFTSLEVPDASITTYSYYLTLTSPNPDVTCTATIVNSMFIEYPVSNDEVVNGDLEYHGLKDDTWKFWMTYDSRDNFGDAMSVPYSPSGTLQSRLLAKMADTAIQPHQANFGFNYTRLSSSAKPAEVGGFIFMLYEIRVLIG